MIDFETWLAARNIDCQTLTPELLAALTTQFEAVCQLTKPPAEKLVSSADCPAKVYRIPVQPTLFDMRTEYQ